MADGGDDEALTGGTTTRVTLRDGIVHRSPKPQSATVLGLLRHLEDVGFAAAPRVHGAGFDDQGRETLVHVEGTSPHPSPWTDEALADLGRIFRQLHELTADHQPPEGARWCPRFTRSLPRGRTVIGHGDPGPWNVLARGGRPVALIDWDQAGPVDPLWDLAEAAWLNVQLHDDDVAGRNALPDPGRRAAQLRTFVDAYGLERRHRTDFVERMVEIAVHSAREEAIIGEVTPDSTAAVDDSGFPVMWAIAWRARAASWMLRHRLTLTSAITAP